MVEDRGEDDKQVRDTLPPLERYEHNMSGWTVYTTRLALLAMLDARTFRSGLEAVIWLGGDADTNGAVAGALLGARFGAESIPRKWLRILKGKEELLRLIRGLDTL